MMPDVNPESLCTSGDETPALVRLAFLLSLQKVQKNHIRYRILDTSAIRLTNAASAFRFEDAAAGRKI